MLLWVEIHFPVWPQLTLSYRYNLIIHIILIIREGLLKLFILGNDSFDHSEMGILLLSLPSPSLNIITRPQTGVIKFDHFFLANTKYRHVFVHYYLSKYFYVLLNV